MHTISPLTPGCPPPCPAHPGDPPPLLHTQSLQDMWPLHTPTSPTPSLTLCYCWLQITWLRSLFVGDDPRSTLAQLIHWLLLLVSGHVATEPVSG